jgi:hypothetical protein
MNRDGMVLTPESQADRDEFEEIDFNGCSCFISPPCSFCTHPGNPQNQDDFDECWEPEDFAERLSAMFENARRKVHSAIDRMKGGAA